MTRKCNSCGKQSDYAAKHREQLCADCDFVQNQIPLPFDAVSNEATSNDTIENNCHSMSLRSDSQSDKTTKTA